MTQSEGPSWYTVGAWRKLARGTVGPLSLRLISAALRRYMLLVLSYLFDSRLRVRMLLCKLCFRWQLHREESFCSRLGTFIGSKMHSVLSTLKHGNEKQEVASDTLGRSGWHPLEHEA